MTKRVSFKVAQALKDAGYPQRIDDYVFLETGSLVPYSDYYSLYYSAPTYLEAWLWLWREKKIYLNTNTQRKGIVCVYWDDTIIHEIKDMKLTDPEEAIIAAIEYLVENDLIK